MSLVMQSYSEKKEGGNISMVGDIRTYRRKREGIWVRRGMTQVGSGKGFSKDVEAGVVGRWRWGWRDRGRRTMAVESWCVEGWGVRVGMVFTMSLELECSSLPGGTCVRSTTVAGAGREVCGESFGGEGARAGVNQCPSKKSGTAGWSKRRLLVE
jgi:hypothetical protein